MHTRQPNLDAIKKELNEFAKQVCLDEEIYKAVKPLYFFNPIFMPLYGFVPLAITLCHDDSYSEPEAFCGVLKIFSADSYRVSAVSAKLEYAAESSIDFLENNSKENVTFRSESQICGSCGNHFFYFGRSSLMEEDRSFSWCDIYIAQCATYFCKANRLILIYDTR